MPLPDDESARSRKTGDDPERTMGFLDHLEELRWTIIKSAAVFLIALIGIAVFMRDFAVVLNWPFERGMRDFPEVSRLVTTTPLAIFSVMMLICFLGALILSLPFVLFFVGEFVAPALTRREKALLIPACTAAMVLFLTGALFSYFVLVPSVIWVSGFLNNMFQLEGFWSADRYYSLLVWMVIGMGAAFQFPMVIQIMVYLDFVTVGKLRSFRRVMAVVCVVAAALITPTGDPINMMIVAVPLYVLYELAIWLAAVYTSRLRARLEEKQTEAGREQV